MKTHMLLLIGIGLFLCSCKQAAGGDYYSNGSCSFTRMNFISTTEVQCYQPSGNFQVDYVQQGNEITFTAFGTVFKFHFDGAGCLEQDSNPSCKFCEQ